MNSFVNMTLSYYRYQKMLYMYGKTIFNFFQTNKQSEEKLKQVINRTSYPLIPVKTH